MSQETLFGETKEGIGSIEEWCAASDVRWIVGVDEAGRGPLAGPVYTAAVAIDVETIDDAWIALLDDSKKLAETEREGAFEEVSAHAVASHIEPGGVELIEELNILQATRTSMARAVEQVCGALREGVDGFSGEPDYVFVDGNQTIEIPYRQRALVKGDGRSYAIAAASILAKVARDRFMLEQHERWPQYNFASNKGYPTREHREAIEEHGPCSIHRKTFKGVREFL